MKKIMSIIAITLMSSAAFADMCTQPSGWVQPKKWHFNAVEYCQNIRCTLIDRSGGVPDPDPKKNNFWENIDWTFSKNDSPIATNQCTAYPMNPACDFNMPRHTCAALYSAHMAR